MDWEQISEKGLGMLVDVKLNITWQCALTVQKAKFILCCIKGNMGSRVREEIVPLNSTLVRPRMEYCIQLWSPQHKKHMDLLNWI